MPLTKIKLNTLSGETPLQRSCTSIEAPHQGFLLYSLTLWVSIRLSSWLLFPAQRFLLKTNGSFFCNEFVFCEREHSNVASDSNDDDKDAATYLFVPCAQLFDDYFFTVCWSLWLPWLSAPLTILVGRNRNTFRFSIYGNRS